MLTSSLLSLCSHMFANLASVSTYFTNLKKLHSKQKHAIRIEYNKDKFKRTRHIFKENKILNAFQFNLVNNVVFMHKISNSLGVPSALPKIISFLSH